MPANNEKIPAKRGRKKKEIDQSVVKEELFDYSSSASMVSFARSRVEESYYSHKGKVAGELNNINKGVSPSNGRSGCINVNEAIDLMQMAYYNTAIVRSTIEMQTEFSNSRIHFRGAKGVSLKFFEKWYEKINGWALAQQWFREWFRSGNVFTYRFDGKMDSNEIRRITRSASKFSDAAKTLPVRYIILNPVDMRCLGTLSFANCLYGKVLNAYEISRLKSPQTEEDRQFYNSLPAEAKKQIKEGLNPVIELKPERLSAVFNGKQDYESLAVPPYYGVLTDLNLKMELRAGDAVIARAIDYATLFVTCGEKERSGKDNYALQAALAQMFQQQSTGRVIFSDYTTKGEFVIPDLKTIFGVEKYQSLNQDIAAGLCNIFYGEDKFANSMIKNSVFIERLNHAREAFLQMFLIPEMKKIADELSFSSIPEVAFEEVNLKDNIEQLKIYSRLYENGALTEEELLNAFETFTLPTPEESVVNQKTFKQYRDQGLYEPLLGGSNKNETGRPTGTTAPKRVNVGPIGGSITTSIDNVKTAVKKLNNLKFLVESNYKNKFGQKRLSGKHKDICQHIVESITTNESMGAWEEVIDRYCESPYGQEVKPIKGEIFALSEDLQLPLDSAVLLYHSKEIK